MPSVSRRRFLAVGLGSAALLAAAGWWATRRGTPAPGLRSLDPGAVEIVAAIVPAVLSGMLPDAPPARQAAIRETVEAFDRAVSGLAPAVQEEIRQLFALLALAPGRYLLAGMGAAWRDADVEEVAAFLQRWRTGRLSLMRAGYQALTQLVLAAWYGNPQSWRAIGYAGAPPLEHRPA